MHILDGFMSASDTYSNFCRWEKPLVNRQAFIELHHGASTVSRWVAPPGAVILGLARTALDPVVAAVGIVALPILAAIKKDKTYLFAAGFALFETAIMVGFISMCIFVFSPKTAIILCSLTAFGKISSTYHSLKEDPRTYREKGGIQAILEGGGKFRSGFNGGRQTFLDLRRDLN